MDDTEILLTNILSLGEWGIWKECIDQTQAYLNTWHSRQDKRTIQRIYLVGCGSSYYAGQVGKYIIEKISHIPTEARQAFSFTNYMDDCFLNQDVLVIGLSSSGNTASTCNALDFARQHGARTLAITSSLNSKIIPIAEDTIFVGGGDQILVRTLSYVQSLVGLYLLALELSKQADLFNPETSDYWHQQIRSAREITHQFFETQQAKILEILAEYQDGDPFFMLGSGPNVGTAEEAALKVVEMAKTFADGCDMEDFFHGRDRELDQHSRVTFLAPQNQARERMLDFLTFQRKVGIPAIVLTNREIPEVDGLTNQTIVLPGDLDELATPLIYIAPLYLLSYQLALKRGYAPVARRYPMGALYVPYRGSEFDSRKEKNT